MENTYDFTPEEIASIDRMITGIVMRKSRILPRECTQEEAKSELWIVALECVNQMGKIEMNLIATKCYSRIVDIIRKSVRDSYYSSEIDSIDRLADEDYGTEGSTYQGSEFSSSYTSPEDILVIKEILSLFKEGSKEYEYVRLMVEATTPGILGSESPSINGGARALDRIISERLGFASSSSSGYARLRNRVKSILSLYENGTSFYDMRKFSDLGFKNYNDCIGWKRVKCGGRKVELEIYKSKSNSGKKYTLYANHDAIMDFDTVEELNDLLKVIKG